MSCLCVTAVSCEHLDVVHLLLQHGAKTGIADGDGQKVTDLVEDCTQQIRDAVNNYPARWCYDIQK